VYNNIYIHHLHKNVPYLKKLLLNQLSQNQHQVNENS
jgi:hypothetical protein